jgi:hypothetical protein
LPLWCWTSNYSISRQYKCLTGIYINFCNNKNPMDEEETLVVKDEDVTRLEKMTKDLSAKIDEIHDREFKKCVIGPILLLSSLVMIVLFYLYFPLGLVGIIVICFVFAWTYPVLHIPLWLSIILLLFFGFHIVTGNFEWTWKSYA